MKNILIFILIANYSLSQAQNEANIWYFGDHAGLDFISGNPIALLNGAIFTSEGCSTISDQNGGVLFYTNGVTVWNNNHSIMQNGSGLMGNSSSTQSSIVIPNPSNNGIFYIFTVDAIENNLAAGLRYSTVDINQNGGLGLVLNKNVLLYSPSCEKITSVKHANGIDYWVVGHKWNSNTFYSYIVSDGGIGAPILTNIGSSHEGNIRNAIGYMKISPEGNKIALAIETDRLVELFDFNDQTGMITNAISFDCPNSQRTYGVEFSPDGTKLYISSWDPASFIYQFDLEYTGSGGIGNSAIKIYPTSISSDNIQRAAIQLGPDKRIYVARRYQNYLGVINSPNELGQNCSYLDQGISLSGKESLFGLPTFIQSFFYEGQDFSFDNNCLFDTTFFHLANTSNLISVHWDFDDPSSGNLNFSTDFNPYHIFSSPGNFDVELISYFTSFIDTTLKTITINPLPELFLGNDTTLCNDNSIVLNAGSGFLEYLWQDGSTSSYYSVDTSGLYWVKVTNQFGCSNYDSIHITMSPSIIADLGNDTILCSSQAYFLDPGNDFTSYLWQNGSNDSSLFVSSGGLYWVAVTNEYGCNAVDSIYISFLPSPEINLGNDTLICSGTALILEANPGFVSYLWNDGTTNPTLLVDTSGVFWLEITNEFGCSATDTISVSFYPMAFEELDLGSDTSFCESTGYILHAGSGYTFYQWQNGSNDSILIADTTGLYYVYVENPCSFGYDSVYLEVFPVSEIDLGNDTTLCAGSVVLLDPGFGFESYLWQDGTLNQFYSAGQSGLYWVEVIDNNYCPAFDTIAINFISPDPELGNDTVVCSGEFVTFQASGGFVNYSWQDGSVLPFFSTSIVGTYWCEVTDTMGCMGSDSVLLQVKFPPAVVLGNDTSFCPGDDFLLTVSIQDSDSVFHWQDGSTDSSYQVTEPGYYWVSAMNDCGSGWDSVYVAINSLPFVFLGNDTIIATEDQILLDAGSWFDAYLWPDGSALQTFQVNEAGTYWVNVFDGICYNSDTIIIEPVNCDLFIPIVFTPNGDQYNESFYARASEDIYDFHLSVFSRWGELIWETFDKEGKWNGTHNGRSAAEGTFFWILKYKCLGAPQDFMKNGSVTLLR
jgi:gliding motility-associated-like protein